MGPSVFLLLSLSLVGLTAAWPGYYMSAEECGGQEMSASDEKFVSYPEDLSPEMSKEHMQPAMEVSDSAAVSAPAPKPKLHLCRLRKPTTTTQRPTTTTASYYEVSGSDSSEPEHHLPECGPSTTTTPRPPCKPRARPTPRPASAVAAVQVVPAVAKAKPAPKLSAVHVGAYAPRLPECGRATTTTRRPGGCRDLSAESGGEVDGPHFMETGGHSQPSESDIAEFVSHFYNQDGAKKDANKMHVNIQNKNEKKDYGGRHPRRKPKGRKQKKYVERGHELEKGEADYELEKGEHHKPQPVIIVNKNAKQKYNYKPAKNSNYYTRPDGSKWWYITNEKKNYY